MTSHQIIQSTGKNSKNDCVTWNRLHSEREDTCEALLTDEPRSTGRLSCESGITHHQLLQVRLSQLDAALDRIMAGTYGECSKCGRWIEDTKLAADPALEFCIDCEEHLAITNVSRVVH